MRGLYCLCLRVRRRVTVEVGTLGDLLFEPGLYIYVGSAMTGVEQRVQRHLRVSRREVRRLHWHIDYLLSEEAVEVEAIYVREGEESECLVASTLSRFGTPIEGFGSSDCRCFSHLIRVESCDLPRGLGFKPLEGLRLH